jgi:uncharacterized membrane protein
MSKTDYFKELTYRLRGLPERERQNILSVYEELFQKAIENGKREEDIADSLGYPRIPQWEGPRETPGTPPAPNFRSEPAPEHRPYAMPYASPYPSKSESGFKAIIASIALGFFNLVFILGPFIGICGIILSLYATSVALLITPILSIIGNGLSNSPSDWLLLGFSMMAMFGLGILLSAFTVWFSKLFFKLTGKYVRFNIKIIRGS